MKSLRTKSEEYYFEAKDLWSQITNDFYALENENPDDPDLMNKILKDIVKLRETIEKINLKDFKQFRNFKILRDNLQAWLDDSLFIRRFIRKVKKQVTKHPTPPEMWPKEEQKEWKKMVNQRKGAAKRSKGWNDDKPSWDELDVEEAFVSLNDFKKLLEQNEL